MHSKQNKQKGKELREICLTLSDEINRLSKETFIGSGPVCDIIR